MTNLQIEYEKTGNTSWINSSLYPSGKSYTNQYVEWLERKVDAARKDEAIAFAEWKDDNGWSCSHYDDNLASYWQRHGVGDYLTTEQLYQLFKQSK